MNYNNDIQHMKNHMTNMAVIFNYLMKKESINKRDENNLNQIFSDKTNLLALRNSALEIFDTCNKIMMNIDIKNGDL